MPNVTVAFANEETAKVFDDTTKEVVSINPTVTTSKGGQTTEHPGYVSYPSTGGGSVTEHATSTSCPCALKC